MESLFWLLRDWYHLEDRGLYLNNYQSLNPLESFRQSREHTINFNGFFKNNFAHSGFNFSYYMIFFLFLLLLIFVTYENIYIRMRMSATCKLRECNGYFALFI